MNRTEVSSSNLKSVGYDPTQQMLEIEFQNGGVYQYFGVPPEVYRELLDAPSHGSFFVARIRGAFSYRRVG